MFINRKIKIQKITLFFITLLFSIIYGVFIFNTFYKLFNPFIAFTSSVISTLVIMVIGFHIASLIYFLWYRKILKDLTNQEFEPYKEIKVIQNIENVKNLIFDFIKKNTNKILSIEYNEKFNSIAFSIKSKNMKWHTLVIIQLIEINNRNILLKFYYINPNNFENKIIDIISELINEIKKYELIDLKISIN